jgi:hypothetical protein
MRASLSELSPHLIMLIEGWGRRFHQEGDIEMRMQRAMSHECQLIRANYEFTRS